MNEMTATTSPLARVRRPWRRSPGRSLGGPGPLLGLLLTALLVTPASAGVRAPLDGVGDFRFLVDLPTQPIPGGLARVDLAVRVDHSEVRPEGAPDRWQRRVAVALKIAREGQIAVDTLQVFEVRGEALTADPDRVPFDLLELSTPIGPGRWAATVTCTLLGDGNRIARASGVLEVAAPDGAQPRLGDPEFRVRSAGVSLPHPQRLYGVLQDTLEVYYELAGATPGERLGVEIAVRDPIHGGMDEQLVWLEPTQERSGHLFRLPLGSFPDGVYEFALRLAASSGAERGESPRESRADFVVSWRMARSVQEADDVLVEASLLLPSEDLEAFRRLSRAAQSQRMQDFWDEHDPTPGTTINETQERFAERVAYAHRHYGESRVPGPLTARGRTYVRYGEPLEVEVKVIPSNGADLDEAIERVHDTFTTPLEGVAAREQENKVDFVGLRRPMRVASDGVLRDRYRNQARVGQEGSFELWIYRGDGDPLFDDTGAWAENIDLRFLFVDRLGIGKYELDFSNLPNRRE